MPYTGHGRQIMHSIITSTIVYIMMYFDKGAHPFA